jgi:hypothetical protein
MRLAIVSAGLMAIAAGAARGDLSTGVSGFLPDIMDVCSRSAPLLVDTGSLPEASSRDDALMRSWPLGLRSVAPVAALTAGSDLSGLRGTQAHDAVIELPAPPGSSSLCLAGLGSIAALQFARRVKFAVGGLVAENERFSSRQDDGRVFSGLCPASLSECVLDGAVPIAMPPSRFGKLQMMALLPPSSEREVQSRSPRAPPWLRTIF